MRLQSRKTKLRRQRLIRKRERKRFNRKHQKIRIKRLKANWFDVFAPTDFDLHDKHNRNRLIAFHTKLRNATVRLSRSVVIDFTRTERMISGGTLLFKAELARILRIAGYAPRIRCRPPKNRKVAQVLEQVGIYKLLKYRSHVDPFDDDVVCWRHTSGTGAIGEEYERVLGDLDDKISASVQTGLYVGIVEAMTNANHHAYEEVRDDGLGHEDREKQWWMFSQVRHGRLSVSFCDLGIGIPRSLPLKKKGLWARLLSALGKRPSDGEAIQAAVEDSRSRTGHQHRGRGLKQLVAAVDSAQEGALLIYSNAGCYSCRKSGSQTIEKSLDYQGSILGTLISWSVPLADEERSDAT